MKFGLTIAFVVLVSAVFAAGMFVGHRGSANAQRSASERATGGVVDPEHVSDILNQAAYTNLLLGDHLSKREMQAILLDEIVSLSKVEPYQEERHSGMVDGDSVFLMHARNALEILGVDSADSFGKLLHEDGESAKPFHSKIATSDGKEFGTPLDFARRALLSRRALPSFPVKQLLSAVATDDVEMLKGCFSDSMDHIDNSWEELLADYKNELSRTAALENKDKVSCPWSLDENSGEVFLEVEEVAVMTFPVVKAGQEWKLERQQID